MRDPTVTPLFSLHVSLFLSYFCSANSIHVDSPPSLRAGSRLGFMREMRDASGEAARAWGEVGGIFVEGSWLGAIFPHRKELLSDPLSVIMQAGMHESMYLVVYLCGS